MSEFKWVYPDYIKCPELRIAVKEALSQRDMPEIRRIVELTCGKCINGSAKIEFGQIDKVFVRLGEGCDKPEVKMDDREYIESTGNE